MIPKLWLKSSVHSRFECLSGSNNASPRAVSVDKSPSMSYYVKITDKLYYTPEIIGDFTAVPEWTDYKHLLKRTVIATSTVLLDMNKVGDFSMPLRRSGQDYATWLMLLRRIDKAYGINEPLTLYRISPKSLSSNKFKSIEQVYGIQTKDEGLNPIYAGFNTLCFCLYAFKKHFMK